MPDETMPDETMPEDGISRPVAAWRAYRRFLSLGFPKRFPLVQMPNEPLIIALGAGQLARRVKGVAHADLLSVAHLATAVWAYAEITQGANWFRRLLGGGVMVLTLLSVAKAFRH